MSSGESTLVDEQLQGRLGRVSCQSCDSNSCNCLDQKSINDFSTEYEIEIYFKGR